MLLVKVTRCKVILLVRSFFVGQYHRPYMQDALYSNVINFLQVSQKKSYFSP